MPIKVLVADDTEFIRRAIRRLLDFQPEIEIVGEAADFAQTIKMIKDLEPHVIVMDLHMSDKEGVGPLEIMSHLAENGSRLLAISVWNDDETKALAATCGASRFLDKATLGSELLPAIKQLAPHA
jgi:DNA-binding NarL/FixJ family response regulator